MSVRREWDPTLLLDMDGVTYDFMGAVDRSLRAEGIEIDLSQQTSFYAKDSFPEHEAAIREIIGEPGFYGKLEVMPGAAEFVKAIGSMNIKVIFCSSPLSSNPTCEDDKRESLARDFGDGFATEAVIQKDKTVVLGDVLVDDKPRIEGASKKPTWRHVVFDAPYNRGLAIPRIISWNPTSMAVQAVHGHVMARRLLNS